MRATALIATGNILFRQIKSSRNGHVGENEMITSEFPFIRHMCHTVQLAVVCDGEKGIADYINDYGIRDNVSSKLVTDGILEPASGVRQPIKMRLSLHCVVVCDWIDTGRQQDITWVLKAWAGICWDRIL